MSNKITITDWPDGQRTYVEKNEQGEIVHAYGFGVPNGEYKPITGIESMSAVNIGLVFVCIAIVVVLCYKVFNIFKYRISAKYDTSKFDTDLEQTVSSTWRGVEHDRMVKQYSMYPEIQLTLLERIAQAYMQYKGSLFLTSVIRNAGVQIMGALQEVKRNRGGTYAVKPNPSNYNSVERRKVSTSTINKLDIH